MIAASLAGQIGTAVAATITVTSVADAGPGSLRDAIATAESDGLADVIAFDASIAGQTITLGTVGDATYGATAFKITTPVTIRGSAFAGMTISGNDAIRPFFVAAGGELILEDLTVTNGRHAGGNGGEGRSDAGGGGGGPGMGGAVLVEGTLVVTRCLFRSNAARGGSGGGYAAGVTNGGGGGANMIGDGANSPSDSVGGAGAAGNASVGAGGAGGSSGQPGQPAGGFGAGGGGAGSGSHDGNAGGFGGGGGGGGISAVFATGVGGYGGGNGTGVGGTGGRGAGFGGAIMNNGGSVVASNSTFTQNTGVPGTSGGSTGAKGSGGAVFSRNGAVTLRNCTLSANTAGQGGRSIFVLGDGGTATLALHNTIAGQAAAGATEIGVEAINGGTTTVAGDHNLVRQAGAVPGLTFANVDPLLFALAVNGGPTSSLAPRLTSPAVNAGDDAQTGGATTDQRGFARQVGTVDIGAVEFANAAPTDIALSAASVAENAPAGTAVGTLSASDADGADGTYTFTLVAGVGDTNNAAFAIAGADLVTATAFDFEAQPSASIRIRVTDQGGATYEEPFAVTVDDVNEPPVINSLAGDPPAAGVGEPVAFLVSATDPDAGDTVMLSIDYGDGASGTALSHAYAAAGAFIVTVTASDGTLSDEETVEITVVTTTTTSSTTTSSSSTTSSTTAPETTTTITSTTATSSSSTTSSTTAPPTTTTTIPPVGPCVSEPTIESVTCRLDLLVTAVKGYDHPVVRVRLGTSARRARGAVAAAGIACDRGKAQRAANRLAVANRMLVRFEGGLEGLVLKGRLPADVAAEWRAGSATLRTYIGELLVMGCASAET